MPSGARPDSPTPKKRIRKKTATPSSADASSRTPVPASPAGGASCSTPPADSSHGGHGHASHGGH
eukprot:7379091-Prymnesium_polylepis.2